MLMWRHTQVCSCLILIIYIYIFFFFNLLIYLIENQTIKLPVKLPKVVNEDSMSAETEKDSFAKGK